MGKALEFLVKKLGNRSCIAVVSGGRVKMSQSANNVAASDEALLARIASGRDREAFDELFQRHEQAAFSLAHTITGSRHLAEETAQEALLKLWTSASLFRGEGTVRAWLLKIVARQSITAIHAMKKARRERDENVSQLAMEESPSENLSALELAGALRSSLEKLPELERRLIALHYGCGMSQPEISSELGIPQQTVSYKLTQTLARLRTGLAASGFAAVIPAFDKGGLGEALCNMSVPPVSLRQNVFARAFRSSGRRTQRRIARTSVPSSSITTVAGMFFVAAVVSAVVLWTGPSSQKPPTSQSKPSAPAVVVKAPEVTTPPVPKAELPSSYHWVFDKAPGKEFVLISPAFNWTWSPENGGEIASQNGAFFLDVPVNGRPFIMTMKGHLTGTSLKQNYGFGTNIIRNETLDLEQVWVSHLTDVPQTFSIEEYFTGAWITEKVSDRVARVTKLHNSSGDETIFISFKNCAIHEMELRFVKLEELPVEFRSPEELTKGMNRTVDSSDIEKMTQRKPEPAR